MSRKQLYTFLKNFLFSILFEKDPLVLKIENMNANAFRLVAVSSSLCSTSSSALFSYKDPLVRTLIWNLKFRKNKHCFELAGEFLYDNLLDFLINDATEQAIIVPVPLSPKRKRERGYNQTELLAEEIQKYDKEGRFEIVLNAVKRKDTPSQTSLSRKERLANLKGVFIVDSEKIKGKNVIILDDVITTGATTAELKTALQNAGAKNVEIVALAH